MASKNPPSLVSSAAATAGISDGASRRRVVVAAAGVSSRAETPQLPHSSNAVFAAASGDDVVVGADAEATGALVGAFIKGSRPKSMRAASGFGFGLAAVSALALAAARRARDSSAAICASFSSIFARNAPTSRDDVESFPPDDRVSSS